MSDAAGKVLLSLSQNFIDQKRYTEAVKCLLAACQSNQLVPTVKAACRLAAARVVLDHFDNVVEAKSYLRTAELELRTSKSNYALKCEVLDALAQCHLYLGELSQAKDAYKGGIKICGQAAKTREGQQLASWKKYFTFRLAEHCLLYGDAQEAIQLLEALEKDSSATDKDKILACMSRAMANLQAGTLDAATKDLEMCASLIEATETSPDKQQEGMQHEFRAPYFMSYVSMAIATGKMGQLKQDNEFPVVDELHVSLSEAMEDDLYTWVPQEAMVAASHLLHSSLFRHANKVSEATMHLAQANEAVDTKLQELGINLETTKGEQELSPKTLADARVVISLKALVLQQRAILSLMASEYVKTAKTLTQLLDLLDHFPLTLQPHRPSTAFLLGHYTHVTREYVNAADKFKLVEERGADRLQKMAVLGSVLSDMHNNGGAASSSSIETLEKHDLRSPESLQGLFVHERAVAQLVSGIILRQQGDATGARLLLTKALKQAHSVLGSSHMVAQVLNALAPVQQAKSDSDGAKQMLESAMTLAKTLGDLPTLITTLKRLAAIQKETDDTSVAEKTAEYIDRKTAELESRLEAVRSTPEHKAILEWAG